MNTTHRIILALLSICIIGTSFRVKAETDPLWLKASEKSLNAKALNDTYHLVVLNTYGNNEKLLADNQQYALDKYAREALGAVSTSIKIDKVSGGDQPVYFVYFRTPGSDNTDYVVAKLVDSYSKFDDYVLNEYQYEYYQLFAISNINEYPEYDQFDITFNNKATATAMSLVPGLGQIYKGQNIKGYVFIGGEAALLASALVFENKRVYCYHQSQDALPDFRPSWRSKSIGWRNFRNISLGAAGALYIYNLIDAAITDGGRNISVKKPWINTVQLTPWSDSDFTGISLSVTF